MRPLTRHADLGDVPGDVRHVIEACLQRWDDSGVLYEPDTDEAVVLVEPGDSIDALIGYSSLLAPLRRDGTPPFEWVLDFGCCFEAGLIVSDDGGGFSLIVPNADGIPPQLLSACAQLAEPGEL